MDKPPFGSLHITGVDQEFESPLVCAFVDGNPLKIRGGARTAVVYVDWDGDGLPEHKRAYKKIDGEVKAAVGPKLYHCVEASVGKLYVSNLPRKSRLTLKWIDPIQGGGGGFRTVGGEVLQVFMHLEGHAMEFYNSKKASFRYKVALKH